MEEFKISLGVELESEASNNLNSQIKALKLDSIELKVDGTQLTKIQDQINKIQANPIQLQMNDRRVLGQLDNIRQQIQALGNITINLGGSDNRGIGNTTTAHQRALRDTYNLYKQIENMELKLGKLKMSSANSANITQYEQNLNNLRTTYESLLQTLSGQTGAINLDSVFYTLDRAKTSVSELSSAVDSARTKLMSEIKLNISNGGLGSQVDAIEQKYDKLHQQNSNVEKDIERLRTLLGTMDASNDIEAVTKDYQEFLQLLKKTNSEVNRSNKKQSLETSKQAFSSQMDVWLKDNSAAAKQFGSQIESIKARLNSCNATELDGLKSEFQEVTRQAKLADKATMTWGDKLKKQFSEYGVYLSAASIISYGAQAIRSMYDEVLNLDVAMTDLMKVTDETDQAYQNFLDNANSKAKNLGRSISSFVQQSANWAKMGYNTTQSAELAEVSSIYSNVADVDDATAVSDIVTALKAFNIEAKNAITIIDPMNKLSNEFAVTAAGLGQGLSRSASTLSTAGTDLEHTLALLTGISEITQRPEEAGNFLKVSVARLQGMKGVLEELGEEVDESVDSISKIQTQVLNLTKGEVNIFDDAGEFRDYYDIMKDIAEVVDDLSSTDRATLYEILFGKNRMNQGAAMIQAFQSGQIDKALGAALGSAGSAAAEQAKWMESLEARLGTLQAAWEDLAQSFLDSDVLKIGIEGLTKIVEILDWIIENLGVVTTLGGGFAFWKFLSKGLKLNDIIKELNKCGWSFSNLGKAAKSAGVDLEKFSETSASIPSKIGLVIAAIGLVVQIYKKLKALEEERIQKSIQNGEAAVEEADNIYKLASSYIELKKAVDAGIGSKDDLTSAQNDIIKALELTGLSIDELIIKYQTLENAILQASKAELNTSISEALAGANSAKDNAANKLEYWTPWGDTDRISFSNKNNNAEILQFLKENGFSQIYIGTNGSGSLHLPETTWWEPDSDPSFEGLVKNYTYLKDAMNLISASSFETEDSEVYTQISALYNKYKEVVQPALDNIKSTNELIAKDLIISEQANGIPETIEEYQLMYNRIVDSLKNNNNFDDVAGHFSAENLVNELLMENSAFSKLAAEYNEQQVYLAEISEKRKEIIKKFYGDDASDFEADGVNKLSDEEIKIAFKLIATTDYSSFDKLKEDIEKFKASGQSVVSESEKISFSELIADEDFNKKIDSHTEKINTLKEALASLQDGSFTDGDFIELIRLFPELGDDVGNLDEAIKQLISDSNTDIFEEIGSYLEYMQSDADFAALDNLRNALVAINTEMVDALDFSSLVDGIDDVLKGLDGLVDATDKLKNGTALTKTEIANLAFEYPKLLTVSNLFTDGSIEGQQRMLDNILKVYEAEYNATIDTKIAELKAANVALGQAINMEKQKATIVSEIKATEVNGSAEYQAWLVEQLQRFNDIEGQNYVNYSNGVLEVNKEVLDHILDQETQKAELSAENVWQPQAVTIAKSYSEGGSAGLKSLNTVGGRIANWITSVKNKFISLAKTIASALTGKEYDDGSEITNVDTEVEVDVSGVTFNGNDVTIDEKSVDKWATEQQKVIQERINQILDQIKTNDIAIENLEALKGLDLESLYKDGSGSSGSGSGSSGSATKSKDTFDWIEVAIERVQRAFSKLDTTTNNTYKSWSTRNTALKDQISKVGEEIELQNKAYERYIQKANSVGLSSDWVTKVQEGSVNGSLDSVISTIDTSTDEGKALVEKIKSYQEWYEKALKCKDAIDELSVTEAQLYKQSFDNVAAEYENILSLIEHEKNVLDEYITQSEAKGHIVSTEYYKALMENEADNLGQLKAEKEALIASLETGISSGKIEKYSEEWYNMVGSIDEVTLAIEKSTTATLEYANAIREIEWEVFDLLQEQISQITSEADFLIDLMSNDKLHDDNGKLTNEGLSTMGLHGVNYNVYMALAEKYAQEMAEINEQLSEDPYDQELISRRQELLELQQESILAAEDEKQAIIDMVKDGIELELDALQERIDAYNEALDSAKNLYDYQKKIAEQTKNIAALEKQLSAYAGDDSEEVKAKVQQLKVSLEEAKTDLEETQYERYISDQQKLLDELYLEYETILNQRLDNVDSLLSDMITEINNNANLISDTISDKAEIVGYTLTTAMSDIWNTGSDNMKTVLSDIKNGISSVGSVISNLGSSISNMMSKLDSDAGGQIDSGNTGSYGGTPIIPTPQIVPPSTNTPSTDTGNKTDNNKKPEENKKPETEPAQIKVGGLINAKGAQIYDYAGDTSGERQLFRNDPIYKVLDEKNGYLKVRWHKISSGAATGWFKKSDVKAYNEYATGKQNFLSDEIAWTQDGGREFIIRPSDGAILTPLARGDSVLNSTASNNIWDMANTPSDFIRDNLKSDITPSGEQVAPATYSQNFEQVVFSLPNVKNYNELLKALRDDKDFEKLILAMTFDQVVGGSSLAKGKAIRNK